MSIPVYYFIAVGYIYSCKLHVMLPSITLCVTQCSLSVSGCRVHIIRIAKKYQEHQSHLIANALSWGYAVLYHGITPQWTDLTYIVANGNFWIWLINWWF